MKIKTEKEIIEETLKQNKENLILMKIMEKFYTRKIISSNSGKQKWELKLGSLQSQIKETEEIIEFLEDL